LAIALLMLCAKTTFADDHPLIPQFSTNDVRSQLNALDALNSDGAPGPSVVPCPDSDLPSACQTWRDYLRKNSAFSDDPVDDLVHAIPADSQVVFLGEDHSDEIGRSNLTGILDQMRSRFSQTPLPLDCIFIEESSDYQDDFDRFVEGKTSLKGLDGEMKQTLVEKDPEIAGALDLTHYDSFLMIEPWIQTLNTIARKHGISVFAYDESLTRNLSNGEANNFDLKNRNETMATTLKRSFANGKCHRAVAFNGVSHLLERSASYGTIPDMAKAAGLSTFSIAYHGPPQSTGHLQDSADLNKFIPGCDVSDIVHGGFLISGAPSAVQILPDQSCKSPCDPVYPVHPDSVNLWVVFPP
jgi:hypothetical protein